MKFIVSRTSCWSDDKCPCEGAKKVKVACYDQRSFKTPEEHDKRLKDKWFSRGTEHAVNKIGIVRRVEDNDAWEIEFNTIEELIKFADDHGDVILKKYLFNENVRAIEIYDYYRE